MTEQLINVQWQCTRKTLVVTSLVGLAVLLSVATWTDGGFGQDNVVQDPALSMAWAGARAPGALQIVRPVPCAQGFLGPLGKKTKCIHPGKSPKCADCPDKRGKIWSSPASDAAGAAAPFSAVSNNADRFIAQAVMHDAEAAQKSNANLVTFNMNNGEEPEFLASDSPTEPLASVGGLCAVALILLAVTISKKTIQVLATPTSCSEPLLTVTA